MYEIDKSKLIPIVNVDALKKGDKVCTIITNVYRRPGADKWAANEYIKTYQSFEIRTVDHVTPKKKEVCFDNSERHHNNMSKNEFENHWYRYDENAITLEESIKRYKSFVIRAKNTSALYTNPNTQGRLMERFLQYSESEIDVFLEETNVILRRCINMLSDKPGTN